MKNLRLEDLPKAMELTLQELTKIREELLRIKENLEKPKQEKLMSRKEVCEYLNISMTTLWYWSKKDILTSYYIGRKVFYKKSEIEQSLTKIN